MVINRIISKYNLRTFGLIILSFLLVLLLLLISPIDLNVRKWITSVCNIIFSIIAFVFALIAANSLTNNKQLALAWKIIAASWFCNVLGETSYAVLEMVLGETPFPSFADVFYVLSYPLFLVGTLTIPSFTQSKRQIITDLIEMGAVLLAMFLVFAELVFAPILSEDNELITKVLTLFYPLGDFLLFYGLIILLYKQSNRLEIRWVVFLSAGIALFIIADALYSYLEALGIYETGGAIELGWISAYALLALGAIAHIKYAETNSNVKIRPQLKRWLSYLPYFFLIGVLVLLIITNNQKSYLGYITLGMGVLIVVVLVIIRQVLTLNENIKLNLSLAEKNSELEESNFILNKEIIHRKEVQKKISDSLKEKEVLLKEIHHRVKNNLQIVSSLLYLQSALIKDKAVVEMFTQSLNRIQSMALVHEYLYQSKDLSKISVKEYLTELISILRETYNEKAVSLIINIDAKESIWFGQAIYCGLIVNELMSNALKHAFNGKNNPEVRIDFKNQDGECFLSVKDNGIGISDFEAISKGNSLGTKIIKTLTEQLKGTLVYSSEEGTKVEIKFPSF